MARTGKVKLSKLGRTLGCALAVPSYLLLTSCSNTPGGEVMIVVTTDMSLPTDLRWVDWTVKRPGYADRRGGHALTAFDSLPGTLAIAPEKEGGESVTVRLEGRTGDATGPVRVSREAHFTVPATGLKSLKMPLNWLCSADNHPEDCGPGMTCEAGQCKSSEITEPLTDYVPLEASPACFDVLDCTLKNVWRASTPNTDPVTGHCFMDPNMVLDAPMNVVLSLNPERVGNAGVCAAGASASSNQANQCFVPLNQDESPDGWQLATDTDSQPIIQLPDAVCEAFNRGAINGVALTHNECQTKTVEQPTCHAASTCVSTKNVCPSTFPPSWSGYSCSGAISPSDDPDSGLGYCGVSDNDPEVGPVVRGHLCCTAGQAASSVPRLIDDMSGGPLIKLAPPPDEFPGNWYTASDDTHSPLSPPQTANTLFVYRDFDPVTPTGGPTISRAACFQMREGSTGYYAEEGFSFFSKAAAAVPLDVSPYTGISFWAKVTPLGSEAPPTIRVLFPNRDTDTEHGSSCAVAGVGKSNCNAFGRNLIELTADWQYFSVRWDGLTQARGFGMFFENFDPHVYSVNFEALRPDGGGRAAPFDFCVSQIYFTE